MRRRRFPLAAVLVPVLAAGAFLAAGGTSAVEGSRTTERTAAPAAPARALAPSQSDSGCRLTRIPDTGGTFRVTVPSFCKNGLCKVLVKWKGAVLGALSPGFFWPVTLSQGGGGTWTSGPAINLAGASITDGSGVNGNGVTENVVGGGMAVNGSSWSLHDDLAPAENRKDRWTFELVQVAPATFTNVAVYVCRE